MYAYSHWLLMLDNVYHRALGFNTGLKNLTTLSSIYMYTIKSYRWYNLIYKVFTSCLPPVPCC